MKCFFFKISNYWRLCLILIFISIGYNAHGQDVTLTYTQTLASGSEVQLNPADQIRYSNWQIDWYKTDGITETLLRTDSKALSLSDTDLNVGERIFARLSSGALDFDSRQTPPYQVIGGNTYNIKVAHDASYAPMQSGETITITSASLQINGSAVNRTPSYRWFGTNNENDLGKPVADVSAFTTLTGATNTDSYTITSADNTRFYGVEISYTDSGNTVTKVLYFEAAIARLPLSETDYKVYEDIMLNQLDLKNSLDLWLDVNDPSTLFTDTACTNPASDGDEVACWQDKSGQDHHVYDMNYSGAGGLGIPTSDPDVGDAGRPVYTAESLMFKGKASLDFDGDEYDALVHKLDNEWFGDFTLIQILGYTEPAVDWESTFSTRTTQIGGNGWPNEPRMSMQLHYFGGNYQTSWRYFPMNQGVTGTNFAVDFGTWGQDVSQVLELRNTCMADPASNPMNPRQDCSQTFYREGEQVNDNTLVNIRADSTLFDEYGINKNRSGKNSPSASHSEVLVFTKALSGCEAFVVGRYIGLKLSRAIGRIPKNQTGSGYSNDLEVLGYNSTASSECGQDFFVDVGGSSNLQLGFDPYTPAISDYDLLNKDEFLLFGHDGGDFSTIESTMLPPTPPGSQITSYVARKWQVEFESPSMVNDPIKQVTIVFNTVDIALQLSNINYSNPYLLIERGGMPIAVDGRYSGNNTITFDNVDLQHNDIVQLTFDTNQPNNAPTSGDLSRYIKSPHTFSENDFTYSDIDNDEFFRLKIVSKPAQGELLFKGNPVNDGDEILASEIDELIYRYDRNDPLPADLIYQVSDGIGWAGQATLTLNSLEFFQQVTPSMSPIRIGDTLTLNTSVEINGVMQSAPNIDIVWWAVDSILDTANAYSPNFPQLSASNNVIINNAEFGKYLMVQSTYTDGTGSSKTEFINAGQVAARDDSTRPSLAWATRLQTNSQYVYDGLVITPTLTAENGEVLPPLVEYCFYNNDTDQELQACASNATLSINSALSSVAIRVEAKLSDPSDVNIATQTLELLMTPLTSTLDLSRPEISPYNWLIPGMTISLDPITRFSSQTVDYKWYRYGAGQYTEVGSNSSSYTVTLADIDSQIMLRATVDDSGTSVELSSELTEKVSLIRSLTLQHETALNVDDEISVFDQDLITQDIQTLTLLNSNLIPTYQWESSTDGAGWTPIGTASNTFSPYGTLVVGEFYRVRLDMTDPTAGMGTTYSSFSNSSTQVQSDLSNIDYDIDYDQPVVPKEDVAYTVYTALTSPSGAVSYDSRTYQWYRINDGGSLSTLASTAQFTPTADEVGFKLRVTVAYLDVNGVTLAETTLDTPAVLAAPNSAALVNALNNLTGVLSPTELSVGMQVSLNTADLTTLAQSGLDVAYQWWKGRLGGGWGDITDAGLSSYTAQSGDAGDALRLCLTLTDPQSGLSEETCSDPTQAVTDNATGYALRELKLNLNSTTDTLSLAADSKSWLDNLLVTESLTASYQWYRVPDGGSVESGGLALGSVSTSYSDYALMGDDDGYRHALRVTLSNSDEVNSELSTVWGGAGSTAPNPGGLPRLVSRCGAH
ncbi:hypothetical protein [Photobacterium leiognathi]|uniref:hypothetical protein n=1 Tax=Photobacterium leiognathi TaxID=553611 RepID=UPI00273969D1|nr:hypothetical protein [Photobacterium leiognathi]